MSHFHAVVWIDHQKATAWQFTSTEQANTVIHAHDQHQRVHSRKSTHGGHKSPAGAPVDGLAMALLFAADRRDHLSREIDPAVAAGTDVISDRYLLSSLAYQAQEAERDWVAGLARDLRVPDLTLLLDLPVEVAAARRRAAGRPDERYDADAVQARVAARYRELCAGAPHAMILDAAGTVTEVAAAIATAIDRLL